MFSRKHIFLVSTFRTRNFLVFPLFTITERKSIQMLCWFLFYSSVKLPCHENRKSLKKQVQRSFHKPKTVFPINLQVFRTIFPNFTYFPDQKNFFSSLFYFLHSFREKRNPLCHRYSFPLDFFEDLPVYKHYITNFHQTLINFNDFHNFFTNFPSNLTRFLRLTDDNDDSRQSTQVDPQ